MRVAIIGQGYVGLTISVGALSAGHEVIGVDLSQEVVVGLKSGRSHIEGISDKLIYSGISSGKYLPINSYELVDGSEVVVIAVPTPLNVRGAPDLSMLVSAAKSLGSVLTRSTIVINESTSHPGTLRELIKPLVDGGKALGHKYAISPERVDPGNATFGTRNTPRVVGGLSDEARDAAVAFYRTFCDEVIPVSSAEVAEAAKLFENTFRFINIGLVNEFSQIMGAMEIPVDEVLKAAGTKPYGFMPFHPNVGIGGHCIPVDPVYLSKWADKSGTPTESINFAIKFNENMGELIISRIEKLEKKIDTNSKILLLGVSYKPGISDYRESPAELIRASIKKRGGTVEWFDPMVKIWNGEKPSNLKSNFDFAIIVTNQLGLPIHEILKKKIAIYDATLSVDIAGVLPI